jgi:hypothetical protein
MKTKRAHTDLNTSADAVVYRWYGSMHSPDPSAKVIEPALVSSVDDELLRPLRRSLRISAIDPLC